MVKDFKIVLNTPANQTFFGGSEITGTLIVQVDEPKSYNLIQISLDGRAHVHWTESSGSGDNRRTHSYTANEVYINQTFVVWSKEQAPGQNLQPGVHNFQFRFQLPANLLSSFQGTVGSIHYCIQARVGTGVLKRDHVIEVNIPVVGVVGVNSPTLQAPIRLEQQKMVGCLCCVSGPITYTVQVPRTGYCIGESVPFNLTVENGSSRQIRLSASLVQNVMYYAQGRRRGSTKTISGIFVSDPIQPRITTGWAPGDILKIPPTETTMTSCGIINISYHLRLTVVIPRAINSSIDVPLTIGNVPLRTNQATVPAPLPNASSAPQPTGLPPPQAPQFTGPLPPPTSQFTGPLPPAVPQAAGPPPPTVGWAADLPPSYEKVMEATTKGM